MTNTPRTIYHDSLADAILQVRAELAERCAATVDHDWPETIFRKGHIAYGTQHNFDFELRSLRAKPTRKFFHVNIERLDNGKYELNCYVL